jgi:hypothetical protein
MKRSILAGLACVLLSTGSANAENMICSGPLRGDGTYNRVGYCETSLTNPDPEVNKILLKGCRYYRPCVIHARVAIPEGSDGNAIILHIYSAHPGSYDGKGAYDYNRAHPNATTDDKAAYERWRLQYYNRWGLR